ncbi:antitoxin Xre/MbcA/ParS toxin-binding domain-containing protein [Bathymodiolus septemdierum thioautotrophic gill symbiont]|uniref:Uncharacterized protein n=1 Tax=endosymbiont of Bathymodiolus septemdierum str. Myojin knoll TaxID=1303921 RepID=A0A0P0USI9_9GAMM|nr:antitoxin Xre/MbcA/ParS toxin-binding domain-containing protein [Bathymodiolus septemdierum thioautotrophic gill symbiont]BAS68062.1 conserved hypothetical protein [endosymbiont of Bathymodiolus septemdierum str. Myojin knoll]
MIDLAQITNKQKNQLTFRLMQVMENWKLEDVDQLALLGLTDTLKPRHLYLYRRGDKAFDFDQSVINRSEMIMGIHEALGTTYPTNREYASIWLKRSVKKFKQKAPLELMLSGETGMKRVWHFLDCTQGWRD